MITITTPYNRGECTAAAIRLADLVTTTGEQVRLLSSTPVVQGARPDWDRAVRSCKDVGVEKCARWATHVVSFGHDTKMYERTRLVSGRKGRPAKHILVPDWTRAEDFNHCDEAVYDRIVCPSSTCMTAFGLNGKVPVEYVRWDSGRPFTPREGLVEANTLRACVVLDGCKVTRRFVVGSLIDRLLCEHPKLQILVASTTSGCRRERCALGKLTEAWVDRLEYRRVTRWELLAAFHACDWAIVPSASAGFGTTAAEALSCGTPVIAHAIDPFAGIISDRDNGLLVECERHPDKWMRAAVPDQAKWLDACWNAFESNKLLFKLQTGEWNLHHVARKFESAWKAILFD